MTIRLMVELYLCHLRVRSFLSLYFQFQFFCMIDKLVPRIIRTHEYKSMLSSNRALSQYVWTSKLSQSYRYSTHYNE